MLEELFHLLVYVPAYNEYPLDKARKRTEGHEERLKRMRAAQQKTKPTFEEYLKNVAQPMLDAYIKSLNPEFVSRSGLNAEQLINKMREELFSQTAYKNYCKGLSVEQLMDKLPLKTVKYVTGQTFGAWRLEGPLTPDGKSALRIILDCLSGNKEITSAFREQDKLVQGKPVQVIPPERSGEFKRKFRTLLKRMLDIIQCAHCDPKVVQEQNDRMKQFVDRYAGSEFVVSIKWTVNRDSVKLRHSPEVLELRRKIYEYFIEPAAFQKLAPVFEPPSAGYQSGPEDLLMDMYLDIQLSVATP